MKFGNGSIVPIQGKGSILFRCKNDIFACLEIRQLSNSLKSNIISFRQMTEEGSRVELAGSFLKMLDKN